MSTPRGPSGRGRGRGRGWGGQNHQNFQNNQQQQEFDDDPMRDVGEFDQRGRGRGRGGRGRGRGRGGPFQNQGHQSYDQQQPGGNHDRNQAKSETVLLLEGFLGRRYDPSTKLLDLSSIASDEEVRKAGMFDSESTQKKFFPALMIICDEMLPSRQQKIEAIESVTLSNNNVPNLNAIYDLVKFMNHIKNLDLSGNAFPTLGPIKPWKNRFKYLEHLIIDPFPTPGWEDEIIDWFPKLQILNGKQVRPGGNNNNTLAAAPPAPVPSPAAPLGNPAAQMSVPTIPMDAEQAKKEEMIAFVQQATNLTRDYAIQCLEAGQWDLQRASDLFAESRASLPPQAFN